METAIALVVGALDSIPDPVRAMLSALVLAGAMHHLSKRIAPAGAGLNVSFRKASLIALIGIPLVICFALNWRFVVVVDELPIIDGAPAVVWWLLYAIWFAGACWWLYELVTRIRGSEPTSGTAAKVPPKITKRVEIWSRRLEVDPARLRIVLDGENRPRVRGWHKVTLFLPRSAERWRTTTLDAVLLHEISHVKHRAPQWMLISEIVAAIYWPTPWVGQLTSQLNVSFQRLADSRASSLMRDSMGYAAALRDMGDRIGSDLERFPLDRSLLQWGDAESLRLRNDQLGTFAASDPLYDRVFWAIAQAVLTVFLLTGTTLREARDDDDRRLLFFSDRELELGRSYSDKAIETKR